MLGKKPINATEPIDIKPFKFDRMEGKKTTLGKCISEGAKAITVFGSGISFKETLMAIKNITSKEAKKITEPIIDGRIYKHLQKHPEILSMVDSSKLIIDNRITEAELIELCKKEYPNILEMKIEDVEEITTVLVKAGCDLKESLEQLNHILNYSAVTTIVYKEPEFIGEKLKKVFDDLSISITRLKHNVKSKPYQDRFAKRHHSKSKW
jgi:hypothetical protein